jgi:hypothetical protein
LHDCREFDDIDYFDLDLEDGSVLTAMAGDMGTADFRKWVLRSAKTEFERVVDYNRIDDSDREYCVGGRHINFFMGKGFGLEDYFVGSLQCCPCCERTYGDEYVSEACRWT